MTDLSLYLVLRFNSLHYTINPIPPLIHLRLNYYGALQMFYLPTHSLELSFKSLTN